MLNLLGGGGNKGNQLIQIGGVFNSSAAVACYILMGALIADATKAKIADATPALLIALGIFIIAFIVILFTKIEEPKQAPVQLDLIKGALSHRHFALGALAIFLYMGIEVGVPNFVQQYLIADGIPRSYCWYACCSILVHDAYWPLRWCIYRQQSKQPHHDYHCIFSNHCFGIVRYVCPPRHYRKLPYVDWGKLEMIWQDIPVGIFAFLLVGLCTSVMWGELSSTWLLKDLANSRLLPVVSL